MELLSFKNCLYFRNNRSIPGTNYRITVEYEPGLLPMVGYAVSI